MLSIKKRQTYLKYLGVYKDKIDGIEGKNTKTAYKNLQKKYFIRKSDIDGIYGPNTEILLLSAYNVKVLCKNFKLEEFRCECGGKYCTGYPVKLNTSLLKYAQKLRDKYGAMTVTSGVRCNKYNNSLVGSIKGSKHTKGKAIDFCTSKTGSLATRKKIMDYYIKQPHASYSYCNGYTRTKLKKGTIKASYMGNAIHIDTI